MLILTIVQLDITLEFFFFSFHFVYTSSCNLVFAFVRVIAVKVILSVCGPERTLHRLCIKQREAHQRDLATMQNNEEQDQGQEKNEPQGGYNGNNGRNYAPMPFI